MLTAIAKPARYILNSSMQPTINGWKLSFATLDRWGSGLIGWKSMTMTRGI
jgi:hypothetical protein